MSMKYGGQKNLRTSQTTKYAENAMGQNAVARGDQRICSFVSSPPERSMPSGPMFDDSLPPP